MDHPRVSIIIPICDTGEHLRDCLESLSNQTLRDIEIICVATSSTNNCLPALEAWEEKDSRIRAVVQQDGIGRAGARNAGLDVTRGEYVWFVDSSDCIDTGAVEFLVHQMEQLDDVDVITFDSDTFRVVGGESRQAEPEAIIRYWPKNQKLHFPEDAQSMPSTTEFTCLNTFSRRTFLEDHRFRSNSSYEDVCLAFSVLTAPGVFYELELTTDARRIREGGTTVSTDSQRIEHLNDLIASVEDISELIIEKKLRPDHFGVRWFKGWARNSIERYREARSSDPINDSRIDRVEARWALFGRPSALEAKKRLHEINLIVSLTSYPKRIHAVSQVIRDLQSQTVRADQIQLWLAEEQFPNKEKDLPEELLLLVGDIVRIEWCHDLGPHKKYYYTMLQNPDSIIITVDDDARLRPDLIELLLDSYFKHPYAVSAARVNLITGSMDGHFNSYDEWTMLAMDLDRPSYALLAVGVGGVLYPPHCMNRELFNADAINELCLYADDLWLKTMQVLQGTPVVKAGNFLPLQLIEGTEESALWTTNLTQGGNDRALAKILERYDCFLSETDTVTWRIWSSMEADNCQTLLEKGGLRGLQEEVASQKRRADRLQRALDDIRHSASYRVGRVLTALPRRLRDAIRRGREHGAN